jgi:hypothetical protein
MKLIRLTTENENALFDNIFNEDIIIKPNSRICLQTMTTQLNKDVLIINNQNNEIQFTLDGEIPGETDYYSFCLENGVYDSSNMEVFFTDFTDKLNLAMTGNTSATIGKQWLVALKGNRVEIQCKRGDVLTFNESPIFVKYFLTNNLQETIQANQNWVSRDGGTVMTNDSFFSSKQPTNKGASSLRCQLRNDGSANTGFILGYTDSAIIDGTNPVPYTDLLYAIEYVGQGEEYKVYLNGGQIANADLLAHPVAYIAGPADYQNDALRIEINNGIYSFYIDKVDGLVSESILIYRTGDTINTPNLFACGIFVGDTGVWNFQNTTDPYYLANDKPLRYKRSPLLPKYGVPIPTEQTKSQTYFRIVNTELAIFLGFTSDENLKTVASPTIYYTLLDDISYLANTGFFLKLNIDSYIVELLNLKINSMDALTNQHKNFLAVIPNEGTVVERVTYIAPVLLWIDLNNKEQINLRQIKARIIREDLTPITVYGLSQLVLLIE